MADKLPTGCVDVVEGAFSITLPNLADVASLDPVTKNDDAPMDPVIKEGASVWNLMTKNVASLVPVTKCGAVASLDPVTKNGDVASLDTDAYPRGAYPDGAYPNGAYPDGAYPDGAYPNGAYPNGAYPNGAYPDGAYSNGDDASAHCRHPRQCRGCRQCECADFMKKCMVPHRMVPGLGKPD